MEAKDKLKMAIIHCLAVAAKTGKYEGQADFLMDKIESLPYQQARDVLICENCKEFWIAPVERCVCGSTSLCKTHESNAQFAFHRSQDESPPEDEGRYDKKIAKDDFGDLFTVDEWNESVKIGLFTNWDGSGYWVRDGYVSVAEVFGSPQLDATHVIWYNK